MLDAKQSAAGPGVLRALRRNPTSDPDSIGTRQHDDRRVGQTVRQMNASGSFTRNNNLKLHYQPIATYSQNVLIALYENGLQFDTEIVQLMNPDQYLRIT